MPEKRSTSTKRPRSAGTIERHKEKKKEQVGPMPTDDPRGKAKPDLKKKIEENTNKLEPD